MRILSIDPGATRAGWAILETGPVYVDSGVIPYPRNGLPFQEYRLNLAKYWVGIAQDLIGGWSPDVLVSETVPSRGMNIPEQGYLANVQITTVHAIAYMSGIKVVQVSANSVKSKIAVRGRGKKITKPQVRNGVISLLPELKPRISDWVKIFEEPDALAVGLYFLGHTN